jgi:PAS domain S-box-containing protein
MAWPGHTAPMFAGFPGAASLSVDDMFADDLFAMEPEMTPSDRELVPEHLVNHVPVVSSSPPSESVGRRSKRVRTSSVVPAAELRRVDSVADANDEDDDEDEDDEPSITSHGRAPKRGRAKGDAGSRRRVAATEEERLQRSRERNKIHARKSRLRKKFFMDSLRSSLDTLEEENRALKQFLEVKLGPSWKDEVALPSAGASLIEAEAAESKTARALERGDLALLAAIQSGQQTFVITDPSLPDNPIVFASAGFYQLTKFDPSEVIGQNCRFLQGPATDPKAVEMIRNGIRSGEDTSVCLLNYRKDGSTFWNQFFVAALRDIHGVVVNFIGVQCEVSESVARAALAKQHQPPPSQGSVRSGPSPAAWSVGSENHLPGLLPFQRATALGDEE